MQQIRDDFARFAKRFQRPILGVQLLLTAAALAFVPGNAAKLATMLVVWALGFGSITSAELILMVCIDGIFVAMDLVTLRRDSFRFTAPNILGLPYYEYFMWGFYVLNAIRFWGAAPPKGGLKFLTVGLVALFAVSFSIFKDYLLLFLGSGLVLAAGVVFFHERRDIAFATYMVAMGAVIEYAGVWSGQWQYDGPTLGGVPIWFITMWGGVGFFVHRLFLPLMADLKRLLEHKK